MTPSTKKLLFTVIRLTKGMIKAAEQWVMEQSVDGDSKGQ